MSDQDLNSYSTVVAVATPPGRGGVGCVRLSGPRAIEIVPRLFRPVVGGALPQPGGRVRFGSFLDREGGEIDHGYAIAFAPGASFTGESTVELWPHGSPAVLAELVEGALEAGATAAGPGEFTYRALCNGRLDLTRAEAVRDLVEARTLFQARVAFTQAQGSLSRRLQPLREELEEWIARAEAAVEFVDESETHLPRGSFKEAIRRASENCAELLEGYRTGRVVRDGATLAMIGMPNVGKSSLFNKLLARDRAIVTAQAGTTRDTLEENLDLAGVPLRLIDTAGLREATGEVESEGVRRAEQAREEADLVLLLLDASRPLQPLEREALERCAGEGVGSRTIAVLNKCDLPEAAAVEVPGALRVSALTGQGLESLRGVLREHLLGSGPIEDPVMTNSRHARCLELARTALDRAARAAGDGLSEELVLEDLREAMHHVGTITGEFTNDDLYERIFSTFCIGK